MTTAGFPRQIVRQKRNPYIGLYHLSATDDSKQHGNDCNHQEYVDETAHGVGSDDPQEPQDDEDYRDSEKH